MPKEKASVTIREGLRWLPVVVIVTAGLALFFWYLGSGHGHAVPGLPGGRP